MNEEEYRARKLEEQRTIERSVMGNIPDPQMTAKFAVVSVFNDEVQKGGSTDPNQRPVGIGQLYVVWFAFTLGNWKCLISSDAWTDTSYFEVSYSKAKNELYVDHYRKVRNVCYKLGD